MNKTKIFNELITYTLTVLMITLVIAAIPTDADGEIYEDTLRLHILANSDSVEDQDLKLQLRDMLLTRYGNMLSEGTSIYEATKITRELLPEIEDEAERWITNMGYDYSVRAMLGEEWYDRREYDSFTLPAGYYTSLRIIIGEGEGQNWWCVMYPPLCMEMATESALPDDGIIDYTKEEIMLISGSGYQVKFKVLEELSRAFTKK